MKKTMGKVKDFESITEIEQVPEPYRAAIEWYIELSPLRTVEEMDGLDAVIAVIRYNIHHAKNPDIWAKYNLDRIGIIDLLEGVNLKLVDEFGENILENYE